MLSRIGFGLSACVWALALLMVTPLTDVYLGSPRSAYDHARQLFLHGRLEKSQLEAERGNQRYRVVDPKWADRFQLLEAEVMLWRGMYEDSLRLLSALPPGLNTPEERIHRLAIESAVDTHLQRFGESDATISEAERLCARALYEECGGVLRERGALALQHGDFAAARGYFSASLAFARAHHDRWLETTASLYLGTVSLQDSHFDEALDWSDSAYRVAQELGDEDIAQVALGNRGWAYFGLGDAERALGLFLEAEKRATDLGDISAQLKWLTTIGNAYQSSGDSERAAESYRKALTLAETTGSKQDIVDTLEDLAHLSVETGQLDEASGYLNRVAPLIRFNGNRLDALDVTLAQGEIAAARHQSGAAESLFRAVEKDPASQISMRMGAEHGMAKLLEAEGQVSAAGGMYRTALTTFESARSELQQEESKLPFLANATPIYDDYIHFLVAQGKSDEALAVADQSRALTLAQGLGSAVGAEPDVEAGSAVSLSNGNAGKGLFRRVSLSPQAVAAKAKATLLFYWLGKKESYLWAVTPEKTSLFVLPREAEITPLLDRYRANLSGPDDPLDVANENGQALYRMLVAPAASMLRLDMPVLILADGALSQLNFETLLVPGTEAGMKLHYWIEDATLLTAPSISMLATSMLGAGKDPVKNRVQNAPGEGGKLLLMGDAISPSEQFPALLYAQLEMRQVEKHFDPGNEVVFAQQMATPRAYLASEPGQFSYIHFVSHGLASRTDPLDSAIILSREGGRTAGAADAESGFKLYARQVMQHPIDARLVTISACSGSGTRAYAGEGLVGLSWAFLHAGAHSVIGALWEVSDNSTPRLMDVLYQGLEAGQPPGTALRNAKLTLLHSRGSFRKAFYWAPFQIYTRL